MTARVYSFNEPSIRLHERLSCQLEGRLRRMFYTGGQHYDPCLYGMTDEFTTTRLPRLESRHL